MEITLKDIKTDDLAPLSEIYAKAFSFENTGEDWTVENARALLDYCYHKSCDDLRLLATDAKGQIIGAFFADVKPWWDGPRIVNAEIFVYPNAQNKGVGSALLKEVLSRAKQNHGAVVFETITFMPETEHPLKWYLKLGFKTEQDWVIINGNIDNILAKL